MDFYNLLPYEKASTQVDFDNLSLDFYNFIDKFVPVMYANNDDIKKGIN